MIDADEQTIDDQYRDRLRSALQTLVRDDAARKHRHPRRAAGIVAAGAIAASVMTAAALWSMADRAPLPIEAACLDEADLVAVEGAADAESVAIAPRHGGVSPREVEAACRALWNDGTLGRAVVRFQSGSGTTPPPADDRLRLVVCALPDGRPGVIPGDASSCASLDLELWRYDR